jgi:dolichol-phosphate mannosyltransferase
VLVRKDKRELATAVADGLSHTSGQVIVVMDADLQHPPEVVPDLLRAIEDGADMAVASRYVKGGGCQGWSLSRRIISRGAVFVSHLLLPATRGVKDVTSGFFAFDRQVVDGAELRPTGYKILLEILMVGKHQTVAEVPFVFVTRERGKSKLNARQQVDYLKHVFSLMVRTGELTRFIKFGIVGLSGVGVNEGLLWLLTDYGGLFYLQSAAIAIEASIITNFILNNYFTFADRRQGGAVTFFQRLLKFNMVSLVGVGINLGVLGALTSQFGIYYLVSNIFGIAVAMLWNYLLNNWWTWRR